MARVLIVEDVPEAMELASVTLRAAGHETFAASSAAEARTAVRARRPDVVLLDLGLPDDDGTNLCTELRASTDAFILMLTSRDDEIDKVLGLRLGADDYVTKPYSPRELVARIDAMFRRGREVKNVAERRFGDLVLEPDSRRVTVGGEPVELTLTEFTLLDALSESPGRVLSRDQLRSRVWGDGWVGGEHSLDVHIGNLRRKVDRGGVKHIRTVRGVGYELLETVAG